MRGIIRLSIRKIIWFHLNALQKMIFLPAGDVPASCAICSDRSVGREKSIHPAKWLATAPKTFLETNATFSLVS
jgi:hypothetical protein